MTTLISNIGCLMAVPRGPVSGHKMSSVPIHHNVALVIEKGTIQWYGPEHELDPKYKDMGLRATQDQSSAITDNVQIIDARGGCVIPGLVDCHTHTVFAGTREQEFVMRCQGAAYEEIAKSGGGIHRTVKDVRRASKADLVRHSKPRLRYMLHQGVTTVEIKSGYGLTMEDELKMLEAIAELDAQLPMELVSTYLAAHTLPQEYKQNPKGYLDQMFDPELLTHISTLDLAEFCDVFCEGIAFGIDDSRRILQIASEYDLIPKVHADQLSQMGASRLAAELKAISADHLEYVDAESIEAMKDAGTIAVLLPGCSFFLNVPQAPARKIIESDLPVAIATDYNPGSSMIPSLPLVLSIACVQMRMTPTEALVAATANAAAALNRHHRLGSIEVGMQADLVILSVPNFDRFCYEMGRYLVAQVIKGGQVVIDHTA